LLLSALPAGESIDSCGCAAGAVQRAPELGSKCGQRHADRRRRRLNADLHDNTLKAILLLKPHQFQTFVALGQAVLGITLCA